MYFWFQRPACLCLKNYNPPAMKSSVDWKSKKSKLTLALLRTGCAELNKTGLIYLQKQISVDTLQLICTKCINWIDFVHPQKTLFRNTVHLQHSHERTTRPETHTNTDVANWFNEFYKINTLILCAFKNTVKCR